MATHRLTQVVQHLRRAMLHHNGAGLTDGQLLEIFIERREDAAFSALLHRHGPMVWSVCYRILRNYHDAQDAFQATFLVLVRKAARVMPREMVANWLYGVAHQTALKARATAAKRRLRERHIIGMPDPTVTEPECWLDEELSHLPAKYRAVIVLCELEGKTRKEAARQLDLPEGTVASRLATGKSMLAKRLARHGLFVSGGALTTLLSRNAPAAPVPTSVLTGTTKLASALTSGQGAGVVSIRVAGLAQGAITTMLVSKLKIVTPVLLTVACMGVGLATLATGSSEQNQPRGELAAEAPDVDAVKNDERELQGVWDVVSVVQDGKAMGERFWDGQVWVFDGNTIRGIRRLTYTLDPSQTPKAIDFTHKSLDAHERGKSVVIFGIYKLNGDDLKITVPGPGRSERPKHFNSTAENHTTVTVFRRARIGLASGSADSKASFTPHAQESAKLPPPTPAALVAYLNGNAGLIQSLECAAVDLDCKQGLQEFHLHGKLAYEKPGKFRMLAEALGKVEADIGCNDREFWYWLARSERYRFYCSHQDLAKAERVPFPVPLEWVMEALGMCEYDRNQDYQLNETRTSYELVQNTRNSQGKAVRKVTVFGKLPSAGQVTDHYLTDASGKEEICRAHIYDVGSFPVNGGAAVLPKQIVFTYPAEGLTLKMTLWQGRDDLIFNRPFDAKRAGALFARPLPLGSSLGR